MTVRAAKFTDVPALFGLMSALFEQSRYAESCRLSEKSFKATAINSIRAHGGNACVFIAENSKGIAEGFIIGIADRIYGVCEEFYATDLFFYVRPGSRGHHAYKLMQQFVKWARAHKRVCEIFLGASDAAGTDWQRTGKLYERIGLRLVGGMYRMEV